MGSEQKTSGFWTWAVRTYALPGVADDCLVLQDRHDQCVPLLLWAAWAAEGQKTLDTAVAVRAAGLARSWSGEVISPLRVLRRRLKSPVSGDDDDARLPLREKIKCAELDAERALMLALEALPHTENSENSYKKQKDRGDVLHALIAVSRAWGENVPAEALAGLTERLTKG